MDERQSLVDTPLQAPSLRLPRVAPPPNLILKRPLSRRENLNPSGVTFAPEDAAPSSPTTNPRLNCLLLFLLPLERDQLEAAGFLSASPPRIVKA